VAKIVGDTITVTSVRGKGLVTRYYLDGEEVSERKYRRRHPARKEAPTLVTFKRQKSVALAVHPTQRGEATEDAAKKGVPTEFTPDGCPVFVSRDHRKKYMRAYGYFDRDAGYGDAAPLHHKGDRPPPSRIRELAQQLAARIRRRHDNKLAGRD
jgi:hypothetical protein